MASAFSSIPTPRGLPLVGTTFQLLKAGPTNLHKYIDNRHHELGPIFRERLGGAIDAVFVKGGDLTREVFNQEGKYPKGLRPDPWVLYNEKNNIKRGLFFMNGEEWSRNRSVMNRVFLPPVKSEGYQRSFNSVPTIEKYIKRFQQLTDKNGGVIPNLEKEMYNLTMSCVMSVLFGENIIDELHKKGEEFTTSITTISETTATMTSLVNAKVAATLRLPVWRRFSHAAGRALQIADAIVADRLKFLSDGSVISDAVKASHVYGLYKENVSKEDIVRIIADLIMAASDTTTHSNQWALYLLGKHPEEQKKLHMEITAVCGKTPVTPRHLDKMHFIKWVVKEALRLYPVPTFLTRFAPKDIVVGNYNIPEGQLVVMSMYSNARDEQSFVDANRFWPERWEVTDDTANDSRRRGVLNPFSTLPFAMGARSCIGKRISEIQLHLFTARMVQEYQLTSQNDVNYTMKLVGRPDKDIQLQLQKRS